MTQYAYDDMGQLIREDNPYLGKTYVYTYDNAGNRTSKTTYAYTTGTLGTATATQTLTYSTGAWGDQLTGTTYDTVGNPLTYNGFAMTWSGRQLTRMVGYSGMYVYAFTYNDEGIRTSKNSNGTIHYYTLEGSRIVGEQFGVHYLIYLYDESGAPIGLQYRSTSYAAGDFDTYYFEKNVFGDIVGIYTADGTKIGTYKYDAWGVCTATVVSGITTLQRNIVTTYNPFRYRGYYYDKEIQLYYLQSRYYDPATGRFLNADGYVNANGDLLGYNMYAYCSNNPVIYVDSSGTRAEVLYGISAVLPFIDGPVPIGDILAVLLFVGTMILVDPEPVTMVNLPPEIDKFQERLDPPAVNPSRDTGGALPAPAQGSNVVSEPLDKIDIPTFFSSKGDIKKQGLPTKGKLRYVPPTGGVKKDSSGAFVDKFDNRWVRGPSRTAGEKFEWDVQLSKKGRLQLGWASRDGKHINVSLKGRIRYIER